MRDLYLEKPNPNFSVTHMDFFMGVLLLWLPEALYGFFRVLEGTLSKATLHPTIGLCPEQDQDLWPVSDNPSLQATCIQARYLLLLICLVPAKDFCSLNPGL